MNLLELQQELNTWLNHNFPDTNPDQQLKGVMEELGELCHADLKATQGIRGYTQETAQEPIMDAVGDIVIYLIGYCNTKDISFKACVEMARNEVLKRDWIKNPENGKESSIETLTCALCGKSVRGRQCPNITKGQNICSNCYTWLKTTCDDSKYLSEIYGNEGYHFNIQEK